MESFPFDLTQRAWTVLPGNVQSPSGNVGRQEDVRRKLTMALDSHGG